MGTIGRHGSVEKGGVVDNLGLLKRDRGTTRDLCCGCLLKKDREVVGERRFFIFESC